VDEGQPKLMTWLTEPEAQWSAMERNFAQLQAKILDDAIFEKVLLALNAVAGTDQATLEEAIPRIINWLGKERQTTAPFLDALVLDIHKDSTAVSSLIL
jgi:membrane-anchored protein YejM (alkaline phosphatase superfamily)